MQDSHAWARGVGRVSVAQAERLCVAHGTTLARLQEDEGAPRVAADGTVSARSLIGALGY